MEAYSFAELVSVAHCSELITSDKKIDNDDISSQLSAQIFEFCDHDLFNETLQNSEEVTSCSNCCYEENSSATTYPQNLSLTQQDIQNFTSYHHQSNNNNNNNATSANTAPKSIPPDPTTILFDPSDDIIDGDISASIDFSVPPQFDFPSSVAAGPQQDAFGPYGGGGPTMFEEDCLSSVVVPPSFPLIGPPMGNYLPGPDTLFSSTGLLMPPDILHPQDLDYQPDPAIFGHPDPMQRVFNHPVELQGLGNEASQQLIGGAGNSASLGGDIPSMGDQTFKVGKLSVEQRKEKIHRYMKKRNERNFSKKIKYACRKTLADSRPRVRGRFAKNDDFGEATRTASSNHEDDDDEEVVVKEEDDMVDSSDIFAHISGVNSFKCNFPIQSWI